MYRTSDGRWEFFTSNSVRSASNREGGGSFGCRVGYSFLKRRILLAKESTLVLFRMRCRDAAVFPTSVWGSVVTFLMILRP